MHVLATAIFDRAAFKTCMAHGIVLGDDGQIVALEGSLAKDPEFTVLLQRAAAARGAMSGLIADLMEERLRSLQAIAESDEARAEVAEMIDIIHGYLT